VVDADIELRSDDGSRRLKWSDFLTGPKQNARESNEIIYGVHLPEHLPERQEFGKVGVRNAMVISTVMGCVARFDDGAVRVALGSVGPTTLRATGAEEMMSGIDAPTEADLAEFQRLVESEVRPITDHRSTAEYRRHAAGVLARRLLERCLA
jgi:CO/xanthine dehydrogenase FAD-binding subunit